MRERKKPTVERVLKAWERGVSFKNQIGLYDTVRKNESFFIGNQWEGVEAKGLPTPVFNFLKRVTQFQVATVTSDNIAMQASPLVSTSRYELWDIDQITDVINKQFLAIFEQNEVVWLLREYMRNAAVDGDGCLYTWFDPSIENGQAVKGEIVTELVENTRVHFGNPNSRDVQGQRYILIERRMCLEDVRELAEENGLSEEEIGAIAPDEDSFTNRPDALTDDKVTVFTYLYKDWAGRPESGEAQESEPERETGKHVFKFVCTRNAALTEPEDTGLRLYPLVWMSWDFVQDNCHGQAMITGLIPNQIFINKLFAMSMISLMTTAYPKIIYDKTRIPRWDSRVGAAIGVNGGDMNSVARIMDPAQISPQIAQFIQMAQEMTQTNIGVSDVAMGQNTTPQNTSAIVALQRASNVPMESTKQNLYRSVEQLGRIYIDHMRNYYGTRNVQVTMKLPEAVPLGMQLDPEQSINRPFDFAVLEKLPVSVKIDVGASSYWSEIASQQTLDNLLAAGQINIVDYLERIPNGVLSKRQELIEKLKLQQQGMPPAGGGTGPILDSGQPIPVPELPGNGQLQRAVMEGPVV